MRHSTCYTHLRKALPLALALALASGSALAKDPNQIGEVKQGTGSDGISVLTTPALETDKLIEKHIDGYAPGQPLRFAEPFQVNGSIKSVGSWSTEGNERVWRLRVNSPNALSINFGFTRYNLPEGASLTVASSNGKDVIRPFTAADNKDHGQLWTPIISGSSAYLELRVPSAVADKVDLEIGSINAAFVDPENPFANAKSGACNIDVVCPQGDGWRDQIRSVGAYTRLGVDYCSGSLVNNAKNDGKPYFLTANHCVNTEQHANSVVVYWNYQNSTCRAPGSPESGQPGDGQRNQFNTGATLRATRAASDFTLLELNEPINPDFALYWSGLDATGNAPSGGVGIHHPRVQEKRISFEHDPLTATGYLGNNGDSHWQVSSWNEGTTEGGSSGSPLYSPDNKLIVGQLHGGYASCTDTRGDWYGRVSVSWSAGGSATTQLKDWLDPDNTGVLTIPGRDSSPFSLDVTPAALEVCTTSTSSLDLTAAIGQNDTTFTDQVTLSHTGVPTGATGTWSSTTVTPPGSSTLTLANLSSAAAGSYSLVITAESGTDSLQSTVPVLVSSATPAAAAPAAPANNSVGNPTSLELSWTGDAVATEYLLEVSTDPNFGTTVVSETVTGTSFQVTGLDNNTQYYWRVTASSACGDADSATVFSFKTVAAPGTCEDGFASTDLFGEDFTNGLGDFTAESAIGNTTWTLSTDQPSPLSGGNAAYAQNVSTTSDQLLTSPAITLPSDQNPLTLKFQSWRNIEGSASVCFDGGVLEVSVDGADFVQVENSALISDPYTATISTSYSNPIAGQPAWCAVRDYDANEDNMVDLSAYAGKEVKFRWRLATDGSVSRPGWYVDDIRVQGCEDQGGGGDDDEIFADGFED